MDSRAFLITIMVAAAVVVGTGPASATDYVVGDDAGWKIGFNYAQWADGKDFHVRDTIAFVYNLGSHNVLKVNGPDFQRCTSTNASSVPLLTGNDVITLATPGKKWYICDIDDHCSKGMKLAITVSAAAAPSPAPMPGSDANSSSTAAQISPFKRSSVWMLAIFAAFRMIK